MMRMHVQQDFNLYKLMHIFMDIATMFSFFSISIYLQKLNYAISFMIYLLPNVIFYYRIYKNMPFFFDNIKHVLLVSFCCKSIILLTLFH